MQAPHRQLYGYGLPDGWLTRTTWLEDRSEARLLPENGITTPATTRDANVNASSNNATVCAVAL
jgi:hypothetical protein